MWTVVTYNEHVQELYYDIDVSELAAKAWIDYK